MDVGIDFGTTFSTLCYSATGATGCTKIAGSIFVETQIFIPDEGSRYYIGKVAGKMYRDGVVGRLYINPKRWVGVNATNFSTFMKKLKPAYGVELLPTGVVEVGGIGTGKDIKVSVTDLICLFLRGLIKEAESETGTMVASAVVTVPADYNSFKRGFVVTALRGLGVPVKAIINEPTAAALYSLAKSGLDDMLIAVFDFGGGTFDVSFVKKKGDIMVVVFSAGDNFLGGRDIDLALANLLKTKLTSDVDLGKLLFFVSTIKEDISNDASIESHIVPTKNGSEIVRLTEAELTEVVKPFAKRAVEIFSKAMEKFLPDRAVAVLTGGSSALAEVRKQIRDLPSVASVVYDPGDFRCSVACGAKVYCDCLGGKGSLRLVDTLTNSLSDEIVDFEPSLVFPKGSPIPCSYTTSYSVSTANVVYGVYEGEKNRSYLNELTFRCNYKHGSAGKRTDTVKYDLSLDGTLSVTINGVPGVNEFVTSRPTQLISNKVYSTGREDTEKEGVREYCTLLNVLRSTTVVPDDILLGRKPFTDLNVGEITNVTI